MGTCQSSAAAGDGKPATRVIQVTPVQRKTPQDAFAASGRLPTFNAVDGTGDAWCRPESSDGSVAPEPDAATRDAQLAELREAAHKDGLGDSLNEISEDETQAYLASAEVKQANDTVRSWAEELPVPAPPAADDTLRVPITTVMMPPEAWSTSLTGEGSFSRPGACDTLPQSASLTADQCETTDDGTASLWLGTPALGSFIGSPGSLCTVSPRATLDVPCGMPCTPKRALTIATMQAHERALKRAAALKGPQSPHRH